MRTDKHLPHSSAITPRQTGFGFSWPLSNSQLLGEDLQQPEGLDHHHLQWTCIIIFCTLWVWLCTKKLSIATIDKNCSPNVTQHVLVVSSSCRGYWNMARLNSAKKTQIGILAWRKHECCMLHWLHHSCCSAAPLSVVSILLEISSKETVAVRIGSSYPVYHKPRKLGVATM